MDAAYDHIQEEILAPAEPGRGTRTEESTSSEPPNRSDLTTEFQETFNAFTASPWGARLGGLWGNVRRQGESYYEEARQEYSAASQEAIKGFSGLKDSIIGRTRGLSLGGLAGNNENEQDADNTDEPTTPTSPKAAGSSKDTINQGAENTQDVEGEGFISRFRAEAAKRLKDIEKAEDAADEALLRYGNNIRNFLRDAVTIAPPEDGTKETLFESKDSEGKRVIHTTRFEAQLHAVHSNPDSFSKDPDSGELDNWNKEFNVDSKTNDIAADLEAYPELRKAMESLVPEKVEYADFWKRYYFLRMVIETDEKKRKELLQASAAGDDEEVAWDEESDSEGEPSYTPQVKVNEVADGSGAALTPAPTKISKDNLKPSEAQQSNDQQSQADSDTSYDLVSGTTSRAPGSPKETGKPAPVSSKQADDSSDEDWE